MAPGFKPADWQRINDDFCEAEHGGDRQGLQGRVAQLAAAARGHPPADRDAGTTCPTGNRIYLYGCAAVALFILLVACINYMNLATARATRRARSVGIRKILGASRASLAMQFLGEARAVRAARHWCSAWSSSRWC